MTGRVKKLFGLLLCMVLLVCLMPVSAMAESTDETKVIEAEYGYTVTLIGEKASDATVEVKRGDKAGEYMIILRFGDAEYTQPTTIPNCTKAYNGSGWLGGFQFSFTREAGHDYDRYTLFDQPATCYSPAKLGYVCRNCNNDERKPIDGTTTDHEYTSFTVDGYGIVGTCKNVDNCHATATVSLIERNDLVYTGADLCTNIGAFVDGEGFNPGWNKSGDSVNVTDNGFTVSIYTDSVITSRNYKILPASLEATGTGIAKGVYGDKMSELTIEGFTVTSGGSEVAGKWVFADTVDGDAVPAVGDSGEYEVYFTPDAGEQNYQPLSKTVKLEISRKEVTVTGLKAIDREYDGSTVVELDGSQAKLEGVLEGDDVKLTGGSAEVAKADAEENKPVTNYGLSLIGAHAGNYTLGSVPALTVNISKYVVTCTGITVEDKVYDGTTAHTYTGTLSEGELPLNLNCSISDPATATVSFEDPNVGEDKALIISGITVRDGNGVDITDNFEFIASVTASITPKTVTVTPHSNQSKTYGEDDPESFGFTATGLVAPDTLSGKLGRQSGENAGVYRFTIGTLENPNYEIILKDAYFTINRLQLTSSNTTVTVKDYTYDGASHDGFVSAKLGGKVLTEGTDFTVEGAEASTVGSHVVTVKGKGNYTGSVTATWVIDLPAIASDVYNDVITKDNVLTDLTADKIDALVELDAALNSIVNNPDATGEDKKMVQDVADKFIPIMEVLNERAKDIVGQIEKWLDEKLPKADADELEMREEYEKLQTWLKGEGKAWAKVVQANLGDKLKEMKEELYTYVITVGNGSHWLTTSDDDLGFRANGALKLFSYVKIDGKVPDRDSYTLYHGSTIVMLHNDYLKTLDKGWHEIQFVYSDGVSNVGKFQVTDRWVDVATGDESDMGLWLGFMLMAGLGMAVCVPRLVRRKNEN